MGITTEGPALLELPGILYLSNAIAFQKELVVRSEIKSSPTKNKQVRAPPKQNEKHRNAGGRQTIIDSSYLPTSIRTHPRLEKSKKQ